MKEEEIIIKTLNGKKFSTKKVDWQRFLKISNRNALSGVLYKKIQLFNIDIPNEINEELKKFYLHNTKRNLVLLNELKKMLTKLEHYKKDAVLIKGFSIIAVTKQDFGERFLTDIDLLCLKDERNITKKIKTLGYKEKNDYSEKFYKKHFHHYKPLTKRVGGMKVIIEIHHQLEQVNSPFEIPINEISKKKTDLFDMKIYIPKIEDSLIYLCTQTSYDNFFLLGIRNLLDIKKIIEKEELNWNNIIIKSKKWNCSSFVYKALSLSKKLLNAKIPNNVLKKIMNNSSKYQLFILSLTEKELFTKKSLFLITLKRWLLRILLARNMKQRITLFFEALSFLVLRIKKAIFKKE
ncbi:MAG: nucleotidyltransferase family protein [DPANN group archaeon]|nr:nucleotidyltransferase family protein [DPANN group archaeon]